ncbi:cutinase [Macrophomina phaseolina]|nr:cutinase [Macrophomina phaseolina]
MGGSSGSGVSALGGLGGGLGGSTQNGLDEACKPVTLIFARGTTEMGNMGSVVGPGFASALKQQLGEDKVAVQGVDYAASAGGIATEVTGGAGTQAMVADVQKAVQKCPDTQIVLSGYSQGAMLVHNTANKLAGDQASKVKAAVTFGDPFKSQALKNVPEGAFKTFCATSDPVCGAGGVGALGGAGASSGGTSSSSTSGHLGYGTDAGAAATFVKSKVQV